MAGIKSDAPEDSGPDLVIKILLVGNYGFDTAQYQPNPGETYCNLGGKKLKLHIKNDAGKDLGLQTIGHSYYHGFDGIMVVIRYNPVALQESKFWIRKIHRYAPKNICKMMYDASETVRFNEMKQCMEKAGFQHKFGDMRLIMEEIIDDIYWSKLQAKEESCP